MYSQHFCRQKEIRYLLKAGIGRKERLAGILKWCGKSGWLSKSIGTLSLEYDNFNFNLENLIFS